MNGAQSFRSALFQEPHQIGRPWLGVVCPQGGIFNTGVPAPFQAEQYRLFYWESQTGVPFSGTYFWNVPEKKISFPSSETGGCRV
jgi:hypothetical protein